MESETAAAHAYTSETSKNAAAAEAEGKQLRTVVHSLNQLVEEKNKTMNAMEAEVESTLLNLTQVTNELETTHVALNGMKAQLAGHNNHKQKIKMHEQLKEENNELRKENNRLEKLMVKMKKFPMTAAEKAEKEKLPVTTTKKEQVGNKLIKTRMPFGTRSGNVQMGMPGMGSMMSELKGKLQKKKKISSSNGVEEATSSNNNLIVMSRPSLAQHKGQRKKKSILRPFQDDEMETW